MPQANCFGNHLCDVSCSEGDLPFFCQEQLRRRLDIAATLRRSPAPARASPSAPSMTLLSPWTPWSTAFLQRSGGRKLDALYQFSRWLAGSPCVSAGLARMWRLASVWTCATSTSSGLQHEAHGARLILRNKGHWSNCMAEATRIFL